MSLYLEEESVSLPDWPEITYHAKLISDNFQSANRGHDPKHGTRNNPMCLVYLSVCIIIYSNVVDYEAVNKTRTDIKYKRKWRQPRFQLHLVTKTHGRQDRV